MCLCIAVFRMFVSENNGCHVRMFVSENNGCHGEVKHAATRHAMERRWQVPNGALRVYHVSYQWWGNRGLITWQSLLNTLYIYIYTIIYIHIYSYIYIYIHIRVYIYVCVFVNIYIHKYITDMIYNICIYIYVSWVTIQVLIYIYMCVCVSWVTIQMTFDQRQRHRFVAPQLQKFQSLQPGRRGVTEADPRLMCRI